jgi:hypothetical protein
MEYKFELNKKEIAKYKRWRKSLKWDNEATVQFIFTLTGIGTCITAVYGEHTKDITDYSSF